MTTRTNPFILLDQAAEQFRISLHKSETQLRFLKEVRIDGDVTQLFVDTKRKELLWVMAFATEATASIKALLILAEKGLA